MSNMDIYEAGRAVPQEATKSFNNGKFSGTDINPMWRIKKLTEIFGPAGIGWYYEVVSERAEEHGDVTIAVVDLNLYIKQGGEWSKPIYGTGGNIILRKGSTSDEGYKMALTDALSVACKALGIGADVYFDKDKTKYTATTDDSRPAAKKGVTCQRCKKVVLPMDIAERRKKETGYVLCDDCYDIWANRMSQEQTEVRQ